jgi:membrane protein
VAIFRFFARIFLIKVIIERWRNDKGKERSLETVPVPPQAVAAAAEGAPTPPSGEAGASAGSATAESPLDLDAPDWKNTLKSTLKEIKKDRITLASAGMAYYFFLAIFPALIALVGIFRIFSIDPTSLINTITANVPGGAGAVLTDALRGSGPSDTASLYATIFGIALAVYSASSGMVALQMGLNVAYEVDEDRKFIGARLTALALLVATAVLGGVPSPFFTFGEALVFKIIGWILTAAAIIILFSVFYYLAPNRPQRPRWQWVSVGGLVGAALWIIASLGFGFYASNFSNYGKTYGTLSGVIILIFWLFLSALAVLVGGELNSELEKRASARR